MSLYSVQFLATETWIVIFVKFSIAKISTAKSSVEFPLFYMTKCDICSCFSWYGITLITYYKAKMEHFKKVLNSCF